jgi:lipopolysaccharide export system protein LptA
MKAAVLFCAVLGAIGVLGAAQAQDATPAAMAKENNSTAGHKTDAEQPIHVNSDSLFADIKANIGIYSGHVVVTQDTLKLRADEVKVFAAKGKPTKLEARGGVVVDSPSGSAIGDFGTYEVDAHLITLIGKDVVLTKDQNVMHGTRLVVHTDTSEARLYSLANNGRVQGLLVPPPKKTAKGAAVGPQSKNGTSGTVTKQKKSSPAGSTGGAGNP